MASSLDNSEILLIDKPSGITSFDVIRRLRGVYGAHSKHHPRWKMGHAGTLDPLASGLMIIGVGEGTKKLSDYLKLPKTYEADILLGRSTDTGDIEGKTTATADASNITNEAIQEAVADMIGTLELPVPRYSAIKRGGQPLYKKARAGEDVDVPIRAMQVRDAESYDISYDSAGHTIAHVRFNVESGVYIRSLAEELGRRLGVPATLAGLRRTRIGKFDVHEASTLDEMERT